ncbi:MAG: hypothetical protein R3F24_12940 [Gammaproteobacteria bacterium]
MPVWPGWLLWAGTCRARTFGAPGAAPGWLGFDEEALRELAGVARALAQAVMARALARSTAGFITTGVPSSALSCLV